MSGKVPHIFEMRVTQPVVDMVFRKLGGREVLGRKVNRVVRLTRIQALTEDVFGDAQKANRWLRENLAILDGKPPLEIARTESGARVVEQMLAKIDWGAAA